MAEEIKEESKSNDMKDDNKQSSVSENKKSDETVDNTNLNSEEDKIKFFETKFDVKQKFEYMIYDGEMIIQQGANRFIVGKKEKHKNGLMYERPFVEGIPALKLMSAKLLNGKTESADEKEELRFLAENYKSPTCMEDFEKMKEERKEKREEEKRIAEEKKKNKQDFREFGGDVKNNAKQTGQGIEQVLKGDAILGTKNIAMGATKASFNIAKFGAKTALKFMPARIAGPIGLISKKISNGVVASNKYVKKTKGQLNQMSNLMKW